MTDTDPIRSIRELAEKHHAGSWAVSEADAEAFYLRDPNWPENDGVVYLGDSCLAAEIVALVNALPAISEVIEAARELFGADGTYDPQPDMRTMRKLSDALARLNQRDGM